MTFKLVSLSVYLLTCIICIYRYFSQNNLKMSADIFVLEIILKILVLGWRKKVQDTEFTNPYQPTGRGKHVHIYISMSEVPVSALEPVCTSV